MIQALDARCHAQPGPRLSRSEAIRRILQDRLGLPGMGKLTDDEAAARHWLLGNEKGDPHLPSRGRAGLYRFLRDWNHELFDTLAGVLEPIGSSKMTLILQHRRKGRPRKSVRDAVEQQKQTKRVEALTGGEEFDDRGHRSRRKVEAGVVEVAAETNRSPSTIYAAKAALKRARRVREPE